MNKINNNFRNTKQIYQIINNMLGRVTHSIDTAIINAFEAQGISAKDLAYNFATSFDKAVKDIIPNCKINLNSSSMSRQPLDSSIHFQKATSKSIYKIIQNLNSRKAPGPDNIKISDIKAIGENISPAIADLINCSVQKGLYPDDLKVGCVRPVYKKGKRSDFSNYRPITLLSSIDKIVEKYVCEQIHAFYGKHKVIDQNQFGFQAGKSTSDLLSNFTDKVNEHLNEKKHVLALFIDFSRAFDTLIHSHLVKKLDNCGVRGPLLTWCENYLHNRCFSVKVDDKSSPPVFVTEGTAQGSVLGPLHFLSYVNDMSDCINNCTCYQFADDTCLLIADKNPQTACELMQTDLNALTKWCHDAGLVINPSKTKLLTIKSPYKKHAPIKNLIIHNHSCLHSSNSTCSCQSIDVVDKHTYLGVIIDHKLNWSYHIEHVCNKLRYFLANITILKNRIPYKIRLMLYNALAESHIQYGLSSYGRTYKTYLDDIYRLQLRIIKTIVSPKIKSQFYENDIGLFDHCKILPVHTQVKFILLKEQFYKTSALNFVEHPVYTRAISRNKLVAPRAHNTYGERTTGYLVPRYINTLPSNLRNSLTPRNLKFKLKRHFLNSLCV